jgi:hypothetical protein
MAHDDPHLFADACICMCPDCTIKTPDGVTCVCPDCCSGSHPAVMEAP